MADWTQYSMKEWAEAIHKLARSKGWHDDAKPDDVHRILSMLALVHSETSEAA